MGISVILVITHLTVVTFRQAAFGALGSGLDITRTAAQSDYLQDMTQGRCAQPDLDLPVALSFTPVPGAPGHVHFVAPGTADPWTKGAVYAGL